MYNNTYIFLCGLHKSGTSLLFKILRDHSCISGFRETGVPQDEGQHLQTVFKSANSYGGPGKFGFNPEARLFEDSGLVTPENKKRLLGEWSQYWNMDSPYLIEKSPPNIVRTRFLQQIFPRSYFVGIMRHPVPTSCATKKMTKSPFEELLKHWLVCHDILMTDFLRIRRKMLVRYESLIASPRAVMASIYDFLNLDYEPIAQPVYSDSNLKYYQDWKKTYSTLDGSYNYQKIIETYDNLCRKHGYSLNSLNYVDKKHHNVSYQII